MKKIKKFAIAIAVVVMAAFAVPAMAAMNPFMDVPASHWAYDAVAQLAARGVISGYPDGTYKGAQPATRYEMASALARALAYVDMEKASKQDVEMLKKLIVEFKDELDALGVKVDKLDDRVAVLEKEIGGWNIAGEFRFDANFGTSDAFYGQSGKNDFDLDRYRIWFNKRINETTSFTARLGPGDRNGSGGAAVVWEHYYIATTLPYDVALTVGTVDFNWEDDLGFIAGDTSYFGDITYTMFWFTKDWGMANLQLIIGREENGGNYEDLEDLTGVDSLEQFMIAGLANFDINEKFRAGLMGYYWFTDDEADDLNAPGRTTDTDLLTVGVYAGFAFTPSIELKGLYYWQDMGATWHGYGAVDDNANAWKVILDVQQDVLKFTSAWLEYGQIDNNFARFNTGTHISFGDMGGEAAEVMGNFGFADGRNSTKLYGVHLNQEWNDKWRTFARYFVADYDSDGLDDTKNWTLGVAYRLNPAVEFTLAYDNVDYGDSDTGNNGGITGDDHMIRFRTFVTF